MNVHDRWAGQGIRVLAVAVRTLEIDQTSVGRDAAVAMRFVGFLTFLDRPKSSAGQTIRDMARLGVAIKLIPSDTRLVASHVAELVGMRHEALLTGRELREMNDDALWHAAEHTDVFVEVDPTQKERIIRALRRMGHVVGSLGDGPRCTPPIRACRSIRPSTWRKRRRTSSCSREIST